VEELKNDGDPWSPVDQSATSLEAVKPQEPLEIKGGEVTAHINLGDEPSEDEKKAADEAASEDDLPAEEETAAEVEEVDKALAEKLAALDAAKSGKKTKK
jgi:hypothetical protein